MSNESAALDLSQSSLLVEGKVLPARRGLRAALAKPQLTWPGKEDQHVPARCVDGLSLIRPGTTQLFHVGDVGDVDSGHGNLMIVGDSADVLPLLAAYDGRSEDSHGSIKLAYLDPPFNTGSRFEHYVDSLSTVAWLDALRQRLLDVRQLLHEQGSVWLHLDDSAQHHGRCVLDEVFGPQAFVATIIWQRRTSRDNRKAFSASHDYIHVYSPAGPKEWKRVRNGLPDTAGSYNPDGDPRGPWRSVPMSAQAGHGTLGQFYKIVSPTGVEHDPPPGRCWTYTAPRFAQLVEEGRVYWPRGGDGKPRLKRYESEVQDLAPFTLWLAEEVGDTAESKKEILRLAAKDAPFDTPKPERLMARIIHIATNPGDRVLDCYLGSGTTAAVAHKMGRSWWGIEAVRDTVKNIAEPRLRSIVEGAASEGGGSAEGRIGGGYRLLECRATEGAHR